MTIQIDDAGCGCLIGGVAIGAYRVETEEFVWGKIPVRYFQGEAFPKQEYLDVGAEVGHELVKQLCIQQDEQVQIGMGYTLQGLRNVLESEGRFLIIGKITGPLRKKLTDILLHNLHLIGVDSNLEALTKQHGLLFWQCVKWLKGDNLQLDRMLPEREVYAKTGWDTYPIWANNPYHTAKELAAQYRDSR
jgi:hypothetical protein